MSRLIVCGGGLAGSLTAIAFAKRRPDVEILLLEQGSSFGGNHIWSFFDSDVDEDCRWLLAAVAAKRWPDHEIRFPKRERVIGLGYNSVRSHDLDLAVRTALSTSEYRLGVEASEIGATHVVLGSGERIEADCVIDARGCGPMRGLDLGWQKFVGRVYSFSKAHGVARPVIMDARVPQLDGFRFVYLLPLSPTELLVEDTYYSSSSVLDGQDLGKRLDDICGIVAGEVGCAVSEEHGILPVVIAGRLEDLWPSRDDVPRVGLRGGFFHPTTGYSLPDAVANAVLVSKQHDIGAAAVGDLLRRRAEELWRERRFFLLLNRMLFRAADPPVRYRVLEHFYRLPAAVIARFYSARLTRIDKLRILSGRPPVPIRRALLALIGEAA